MSEPLEPDYKYLLDLCAECTKKREKEIRQLEACLQSCRIMLRNGYSHAEVIHKISVYLKEPPSHERL